MPGGAPAPMQFAPLQFAQGGGNSIGQALQGLNKNLPGAKTALQGLMPNGAAAPGDTTVGAPGSPYAGPVAPNAGANMGAAGTGLPGNPAAGPVAPQTGQPGPSMNDIMRNMSPPMLLDWLKRTAGLGPMAPALPGAAALSNPNVGMLPSAGPNPYGGWGG